MTYDELFRQLLVDVSGTRVYHLEVFQKESSVTQYPCLVYRLTDTVPEKELGGANGYYTSVYDVYVFTVTSDDLRTLSDAVVSMGTELFNVAMWQDSRYANIDSVDVDTEVEEDEFAIQQQELGYKTSTISVSMFYSRCVIEQENDIIQTP